MKSKPINIIIVAEPVHSFIQFHGDMPSAHYDVWDVISQNERVLGSLSVTIKLDH